MKKGNRIISLVLCLVLFISIAPISRAASQADSIVAVANGERGTTGGTKYCDWFYGTRKNVAWCAIFVSWCANKAGIPTSVIPKTASVSVMYSGIINAGGKVVTSPKAGDVVFYWSKDNNSWAHVGLMTGNELSVQGNIADAVCEVQKANWYRLPGNSTNYNIVYVRPNYSNTAGAAGTSETQKSAEGTSTPIPASTISATTKGADSVTTTSAILRGEVSSSGTKITECGMYIGTSKSNLTLLGSDKGLSTYGTACYYSTEKYGYTLKPGTTYYYQVYAIAGGKTEKGEIKSFTTIDVSTSVSFIWPTDVHTLVQGYSQSHGGLDIRVSSGSSVYASASGTVIYVYSGCNNVSGANSGRSCVNAGLCSPNAGFNKTNGYCNEGFGNGVVIQHKDGSYTAYAHMLANSITVKVGDTVTQGTLIGKSGSSGLSTGAHLHFSLLRASNLTYWAAFNQGYAVNPIDYLEDSGTAPTINLSATTITKGETVKVSWDATFGLVYTLHYWRDGELGSTSVLWAESPVSITNLDPGTYKVQLTAQNDAGTVNSNTLSLTVQENETTCPAVIVSTKGADNITENSAILRGDFSVTGGKASECGMYLGTSSGNLTKLGSDAINSTGVASYYSTSKFGRTLTPGTTYYYQAYVVVDGRAYYGEIKSFKTTSSVTVTTKGADNITATSAIVRGEVSSSKQKASECGMYFGTDPNNLTKLGSDAISAYNMPFYYSTSKYGRTLTKGTTYYYRAYAIVGGVTYWGEIKSFTTSK